MSRTNCFSHSALIAGVISLFAHVPGSGLASRPFTTEDAGVGGKGAIQLEVSWDYMKWRNNDREHVMTLVPIFGISDEVEFSLEAPLMFHYYAPGHGHRVWAMSIS